MNIQPNPITDNEIEMVTLSEFSKCFRQLDVTGEMLEQEGWFP